MGRKFFTEEDKIKQREKFIEKSNQIWGNKYDYSKVDYVSFKVPVCIICPEHGEFWQTPAAHYHFNGCKGCSSIYKGSLRRSTTEEFIEKCKKIYDDKYDYSLVNYITNSTNVDIICPKHGKVSVNPSRFLNGKGCPMCNKEKPSPKIKPFNEILESFRKVHGDRYEYDESTYAAASKKMRIICPDHGEFWQTPLKHISGHDCPKCAHKKIGENISISFEEFIERAKSVHNGKYDYSKVDFVNMQTKVCIICPEHGEFYQSPTSHLMGCGCPKCAIKDRANKCKKDETAFIDEAKKVHDGDGYSYEKVKYINRNTPVEIICSKHGSFFQKPSKHLMGHGCPKCASSGIHSNTDEYIEKANEIHGGKYSYSGVTYTKSTDKIKITCPIHGDFYQEAESHLSGHGCPKCAHGVSVAEGEIADYLSSILTDCHVETRNRTILSKKEIDILIPEKHLGIEYNGLYWHSDKFVDNKNAHLIKTLEAKKAGIDLLQIFEDEWKYKEDIVKSKLKHLLGLDTDLPKVMGRKCEIMEIGSVSSKKFLNKHHIQGQANATVHLGAFSGKKLVAVMLFKKDATNDGWWELNRYASDIGLLCQGVASKLLSYFIKEYSPKHIKSFADRRWTVNSENNMYTKLGFRLESTLPPDYRYFMNNKTVLERIHKFNFRKKLLNKKYGLPMGMSEKEMTKAIGAYRIWDCGLFKYTLTIDN